MAKTVTVIPAKEEAQERLKQQGPLRVAAYCRVSTDDEEQITSYKNQIEVYTQLIESNPSWKLAGIYADEGLSGTNTRKRPEFNRLMAACRRGRIDRIITKSVSRFARNTVDCLHYVRMLKELGVSVYFEKEGIDTSEMTSEMLLTIFGSFAQAESESISANVTWGIHKSFQDGNVPLNFNRLLGYKQEKDGEPEIDPEEAKIVRRIFRAYLAGQSAPQIVQKLTHDGVPPPNKSKAWNISRIQSILKNEKYMGDALLQKSYTLDCISGKTKKNNGERPQYYVKDNHPAIVSRELFNMVQEEIARRNSKPKSSLKPRKTNKGRFSCKYALTEIMRCGECDAPYRRVTWTSCGNKRIVWRCISRLEKGKEVCKHSPTIPEPMLHAATMKGIWGKIAEHDPNGIITDVGNALSGIMTSGGAKSFQEIEDEIKRINDEMLQANALIADASVPDDYLDLKYMELANRVAELRKEQAAGANRAENEERLQAMRKAMHFVQIDYDAYSDNLVRHEISEIIVVDKDSIKIIFHDGASVCIML